MTLDIKTFLKQADANDDKVVDKEEFYTMMKKVVEDGNLQKDAAVKIQAISRGKADRAAVETKKSENAAATKIQARSRGRASRKDQSAAGADNESREKSLFEELDLKGNGAIDIEELNIFLGADADTVIKEMDTIQKDGKIQLNEWLAFFKDLQEKAPEVVSTHLTQLEGLIQDKKQEAEAAVKIQAISRGKKDREAVDQKKSEIAAATKIQAINRGKVVRNGGAAADPEGIVAAPEAKQEAKEEEAKAEST